MFTELNNSNVWLGTRESHQAVLTMLKAKDSGTLLTMMMENPELAARSNRDDDDDFRIGAEHIQIEDGVAVISIKGTLVASYAWYNSWFGVISYEEIRDAVEIAASDDNVKKILLDIDSPGGAVSFLDEIADYIYFVDKNIKPVEGHTSSHAHSAGYWLLSSTRKIIASKMASTGSIGVIMTMISYAGMLEEAGIEYHYVRSGKFKALGQAGEKLSDTAKAEAQEFVSELFEFFVAQVIRGRGALALANKDAWIEGKTFLPKKALAIGLIDDVNTFDGHIAKLYENSNNGYINSESGLSKEAIMKSKLLTAEQQAKLSSGVALEELGLSAKDLAAIKDGAKTKADDKGGEEVSASDDKGGEEIKAASDKGGEEVSASDDTDDTDDKDDKEVSAELKTVLKMNAKLNKQLAKAELKLETEQAAHAETKESITSLKSMQTQLTAIAGEALGKLQLAVGAQATSLEGLDAAAIVNQYTEARVKFEATYTVGPTSKTTVNDRADETSLKPRNEINKLDKS